MAEKVCNLDSIIYNIYKLIYSNVEFIEKKLQLSSYEDQIKLNYYYKIYNSAALVKLMEFNLKDCNITIKNIEEEITFNFNDLYHIFFDKYMNYTVSNISCYGNDYTLGKFHLIFYNDGIINIKIIFDILPELTFYLIADEISNNYFNLRLLFNNEKQIIVNNQKIIELVFNLKGNKIKIFNEIINYYQQIFQHNYRSIEQYFN